MQSILKNQNAQTDVLREVAVGCSPSTGPSGPTGDHSCRLTFLVFAFRLHLCAHTITYLGQHAMWLGPVHADLWEPWWSGEGKAIKAAPNSTVVLCSASNASLPVIFASPPRGHQFLLIHYWHFPWLIPFFPICRGHLGPGLLMWPQWPGRQCGGSRASASLCSPAGMKHTSAAAPEIHLFLLFLLAEECSLVRCRKYSIKKK